MITTNVLAGFRGTGLILYNPEAILSKLNIKLRTPTPTKPSLLEVNPWVSQTPQNPAEAISQSDFVRKRIDFHQGSFPIMIFSAIKQLAKGNDRITHELTLMKERVHTLKKANAALSKRQRAKHTRVQDGESLTIEDAQKLIAEKEAKGFKRQKRLDEEGGIVTGLLTSRHYGNCEKARHNV
jgi:hypothetical protein